MIENIVAKDNRCVLGQVVTSNRPAPLTRLNKLRDCKATPNRSSVPINWGYWAIVYSHGSQVFASELISAEKPEIKAHTPEHKRLSPVLIVVRFRDSVKFIRV